MRQELQRASPRREEGAAATSRSIGLAHLSDGPGPSRIRRAPRDTLPPMENDDIAATTTEATVATEAPADLIEELLVEEISIDGMCGVY